MSIASPHSCTMISCTDNVSMATAYHKLMYSVPCTNNSAVPVDGHSTVQLYIPIFVIIIGYHLN